MEIYYLFTQDGATNNDGLRYHICLPSHLSNIIASCFEFKFEVPAHWDIPQITVKNVKPLMPHLLNAMRHSITSQATFISKDSYPF